MDKKKIHLPVLIAMLQHVQNDDAASTFQLFGQPLSTMLLEGIVTSMKTESKFTLDDGTGVIAVSVGKFASKAELAHLRIGSHFAVVGKFKSQKSIKATNIMYVPSASSQFLHMLRVADAHAAAESYTGAKSESVGAVDNAQTIANSQTVLK